MGLTSTHLRAFSGLREFSNDDLDQMAGSLSSRQLRAGAKICRQGEEGECCFFLASGRATVRRLLDDGRLLQLGVLDRGAIFGQTGLVPRQERTADVIAETDVTLLTLPRVQLDWGLKNGKPWAIQVHQLVAAHLVRQVRRALSKLETLADEPPIELPPGPTSASRSAPLHVRAPRANATGPSAQRATSTRTRQSGDQALMELLATAEASFAEAGFDLDDVSFVVDERRTHSHKKKWPS